MLRVRIQRISHTPLFGLRINRMALAPIILFVYNRPDMVELTLKSLQQNELAAKSELFIYADGPKENATPEQLSKIKQVREVIKSKNWCGTVNIIEREKNKGLAPSVIEGVTEIVNKYEKVIVVEDDVLLSPYFLNYMNDALEVYKDNEKVLSVGSWNYFASGEEFKNDHFFFRYPDSIAWATYKRSWTLFESNAEQVYAKLKKENLLSKFNGDGNAKYFENMLKMQIEGNINSWAIRWTATAAIHKMLAVFPKVSMSKHIGFGAEATHEKSEVDYNANLEVSNRKLNIVAINPVEENKLALSKWISFVKSNFVTEEVEVTFGFKVKRKIKSILKKFK